MTVSCHSLVTSGFPFFSASCLFNFSIVRRRTSPANGGPPVDAAGVLGVVIATRFAGLAGFAFAAGFSSGSGGGGGGGGVIECFRCHQLHTS